MKKLHLTFFAAVVCAFLPVTGLSAQSKSMGESFYQKAVRLGYKPFYTTDVAPHLENVLPNPPDTCDALFVNDVAQYEWGKSVRDTERGRQAIVDATVGADFFFDRYGKAMGRVLTEETNPVLYELVYRVHMTEMQAGDSAKKYFRRKRPYQQFAEPSAVPAHEHPNDFTSYPSGHTHVAWAVGLVMTAIDPDKTEEIMKAAYEVGQSRVIVGYHYQSDVDAGRLAGSITFARLCAIPEFLDLLQRAKEEFNATAL